MGYTFYPKKFPKSKFRGVKYAGIDLGKKLWVASFTHKHETLTSAKFRSELLAAKWYDRTALKYLGDSAVLNCPDKLIPNRTIEETEETDAETDAETDVEADTLSISTETASSITTSTPETSYIVTTFEDEKPTYSCARSHTFFTETPPTANARKRKKPINIKKAQKMRLTKSNEPNMSNKPNKPNKPKYETGTKRKKFTQQTKNKICSRQKWNCNFCHRRLGDVYHIDHMIPLFMGGSNETWNLQSLCPSCDSFNTSYLDNKILFPISKERKITTEDVVSAQKSHYHMMECEHPSKSSPSTTVSEPKVSNTINLNSNLFDISKLISSLDATKGFTISIQPTESPSSASTS